MFTQANVATNKKPNLRRRIDFTKVAPLGNAKKSPIFHCRYAQSTAESEKILPGSVRPCQETEQLDFPRKCLNTVKSRTVLTTIGIWHLHFITLLLESQFTQAIMLKRKINCIRFKRPNLPLSQLHYVFLHKFITCIIFKKIDRDSCCDSSWYL